MSEVNEGPWTRFMDMHSGGGQKLDWPYIAIQASEDEARRIFYGKFGRNPERVTCTCCGEDYSVSESPTLAEATAYDRNLRWVEDARGYAARSEPDFLKGRYLEPGEDIPRGMSVSMWASRRGEGIAFAAFMRNPERHGYKLVTRGEITEADTANEPPAEGYVWAGDEE